MHIDVLLVHKDSSWRSNEPANNCIFYTRYVSFVHYTHKVQQEGVTRNEKLGSGIFGVYKPKHSVEGFRARRWLLKQAECIDKFVVAPGNDSIRQLWGSNWSNLLLPSWANQLIKTCVVLKK